MDKKSFIKHVTEYLEDHNIPYRLNFKSDISINTSFKSDDDKEDDDVFLLIALLIDTSIGTVFAYERVRANNQEITDPNVYVNTMIKTGLDSETKLPISNVIEKIEAIAIALGFKFVKTSSLISAQYPVTTTTAKQPLKPRKQMGLIIIAVVALISVAVVIGLLLNKNGKDPSPDELITDNPSSEVADSGNTGTSGNDTSTGITGSSSDSAVVSSGVDETDLGNIMNGQYYFATDKLVFYSSFDTNDKAHIYSAKIDGSELKPIFDGFGWSLVVIDDWLYFSGNQGDVIDGTYHIFRMKLDGSSIEKINDRYSYGVFLYGDYLYYMTSNVDYPDSMSIARSSLDGSNKEILFDYGYNPLIYKDQLYYFDNQGNMYRTAPDGSNPEVLIAAAVRSYSLSGGKIIYNDFSNNINICDLDGSNNKVIRNSKGVDILNVNVYGDRIFFSEYNTEFNYTAYGYDYTIFSIKLDGSDERSLFTSVSYGIYMNIVNDKLMLMDYTRSDSSDVMSAIIKVMNLDGSNVNIMNR